MPNWCMNKLEIDGPEAAVAKAKKLIYDENGEVSFSIAVPPPPFFDRLYGKCERFVKERCDDERERAFRAAFLDLFGIDESFDDALANVRNTDTWHSLVFHDFLETHLREVLDLPPTADSDVCIETFRKFGQGFGHGNAWREKYWGTKWDANQAQGDFFPDHVSVLFDTAWTPPIPWLAAVSAKCPEAKFSLWFAEPGNDIGGLVSAENGDVFLNESEGAKEEAKERLILEEEFYEDDEPSM